MRKRKGHEIGEEMKVINCVVERGGGGGGVA